MFDLRLPIELGLNLANHQPLFFELALFALHVHLLGATGSGKTSAMETLLYQLWLNADPQQSFFIIDLLGSSRRLLRFIANPEFCDESIRRRLVYFEPAREQYTTTMHPLEFNSRANQDYQVERTMDLILRGFESQTLAAMPRLRMWLYRCIFGLTLLGFPLAIARYLLHPKSREHPRLIAMLPLHEQAEWHEILKETKGQAAIILEAARNRISMINDYVLLQRFFGSVVNRFDVRRFMDEGKIVIINLSAGDRQLSSQAANMIGSLIANEVFNQSMAHFATTGQPTDTFLCVDEFHRLLSGPEILDFLPIVRNVGLHLLLANQSFGQLVQPDMDLRPLVAQARSRLMFANDFMDADILAEEVANFKWDPDEIKRTYESYRTRIAGYEKMITESWGDMRTGTKSWTHQESSGRGATMPEEYWKKKGSTSQQRSAADTDGGSRSDADSHGMSEHLVPIHQEFYETVRVDYRSREEVVHQWRRNIRAFQTGECLVKLANDSELYRVLVNYLPQYEDPRLDAAVEELLARNFAEGPFITAEQADRELDEIRQKLLTGPKLIVPRLFGTPFALTQFDLRYGFRSRMLGAGLLQNVFSRSVWIAI